MLKKILYLSRPIILSRCCSYINTHIHIYARSSFSHPIIQQAGQHVSPQHSHRVIRQIRRRGRAVGLQRGQQRIQTQSQPHSLLQIRHNQPVDHRCNRPFNHLFIPLQLHHCSRLGSQAVSQHNNHQLGHRFNQPAILHLGQVGNLRGNHRDSLQANHQFSRPDNQLRSPQDSRHASQQVYTMLSRPSFSIFHCFSLSLFPSTSSFFPPCSSNPLIFTIIYKYFLTFYLLYMLKFYSFLSRFYSYMNVHIYTTSIDAYIFNVFLTLLLNRSANMSALQTTFHATV